MPDAPERRYPVFIGIAGGTSSGELYVVYGGVTANMDLATTSPDHGP